MMYGYFHDSIQYQSENPYQKYAKIITDRETFQGEKLYFTNYDTPAILFLLTTS